ncbi:MAG: dipeptidase [Bacteroidetes bacterium]|nr:dipeptidase [Bacteroidota bacterium]
MEQVSKYIKSNFDNYIEELKDYLRIPSISSLPQNKNDMQTCAKFVANQLKNAGMNKTEVIQTEGHPLVYGEWLGAPGKPTVLIYGHYDVQPVDPLDLWHSQPFDPVIKDKKIWARGASDDKGQTLIHMKAVEAYFKTVGSLPVNVKFIIEGEEEVGSPNLGIFLKNNKEKLKCDSIMVSDTSLQEPGIPTITYGLRGLAYMELELIGPDRDLHSGAFGGAIGNPINELAKIIAKLQDKNGKITIPGFYDDVKKATKKERENFKSLNFSDKKLAKEFKVKELQGEKGFTTIERLWIRPTLDCNGIVGGYTGEGAKTVLPSKASAKISMRLVPDQTPKKIAKLFTKYVQSLAPKSMKMTVKDLHGGYPIVVDLNDRSIDAAARALKAVYGKEVLFAREGGSIPIIVEFVKQLKAPTVLMGFGLETDNIHSPNEHFLLENFEKGLLSSAKFFEEYAK